MLLVPFSCSVLGATGTLDSTYSDRPTPLVDTVFTADYFDTLMGLASSSTLLDVSPEFEAAEVSRSPSGAEYVIYETIAISEFFYTPYFTLFIRAVGIRNIFM
jgi:hypothetical protein